MKKVLILCVLAWSGSMSAKDLKWCDGTVVLSDEKVLEGEILFEPTNDLILLRTGGPSVTTYTAYRIKSFHFYDAEQNINRKFISLRNHEGTKTSSHFYEVVLRGKVSILRQPKPGLGINAYSNFDNRFSYFIQMDNQVTSLNSFRKNVFPILLRSHINQITTFIYQNNLNPNFQDSAIKIIEFYNRQESLNAFATNK